MVYNINVTYDSQIITHFNVFLSLGGSVAGSGMIFDNVVLLLMMFVKVQYAEACKSHKIKPHGSWITVQGSAFATSHLLCILSYYFR